MTKLFGVIGDPIAHSLSPLIHKGWMRDHHLAADYLGLEVPEGEFPDAMKTLTRKGFKGLNVTMPHKLAALEFASDVTSRAGKIGAVNTLWREGDGYWHGDNTDAPGFHAALLPLVDAPLEGQTALVFGAGGAARGILYALDGAGVRVVLANRTVSRAAGLLGDYPGRGHTAIDLAAGLAMSNEVDFVVNTTSVGYAGQSLDLPMSDGRLFYDISYGPASKPVLPPAREKGWRTADGLSMLVYQAAFAFERWFDIMPDVEKGMQRCRAVLEVA